MKKMLLAGHVACGKTTLAQRLNGLQIQYKKTQALEIINQTIDTPGEYLEHRSLLRALFVLSVDVDVVVLVQDASSERYMFSAGQSMAFPVPCIGVVSKADLATQEQIDRAIELLEMTGASPIFVTSATTGQGIDELAAYLEITPDDLPGAEDGKETVS